MRKLRLTASIALPCFFLLGIPSLDTGMIRAQDHTVDLTQLIKDTQIQSPDPKRLALTWWLPKEFWEASSRIGSGLDGEQLEEFLAVVRPYVIVAALDGAIGPLGGATFVDKESMRGSIVLVDASGAEHPPLPEEQVSSDARNLAGILGSIFSNMMGEMGKNFHVFFFPAETSTGARIADASAEGTFSVRIDSETFTYDLPLGSALAPKILPGGWRRTLRPMDVLPLPRQEAEGRGMIPAPVSAAWGARRGMPGDGWRSR